MKHYQRLVRAAVQVEIAKTPFERMKALYGLRAVLNKVDPVEMFISVDTKLSDLEELLSPEQMDVMRALGYQFPEDFDEPKKMFSDGCNS